MTKIFTHPSFDNHEQVLFVSDTKSGLNGIIAIHNTELGPAAGGCRMYPYHSVDDAVSDVLRLSRGMTMKNAAAGLPLGGGKCVIIADPASTYKEALLRSMAQHVQRLAGKYWTAIDVGVSAEDADVMAEECDFIFARASQFSKLSRHPSLCRWAVSISKVMNVTGGHKMITSIFRALRYQAV